jgi:hypothetical protein
VGVLRGGKTGTDVQELPDALLLDQVAHAPAEEGPVHAREPDDVGIHRRNPVADLAVNSEVVLTAQPVVPDPGGVRHVGVDQATSSAVVRSSAIDGSRSADRVCPQTRITLVVAGPSGRHPLLGLIIPR